VFGGGGVLGGWWGGWGGGGGGWGGGLGFLGGGGGGLRHVVWARENAELNNNNGEREISRASGGETVSRRRRLGLPRGHWAPITLENKGDGLWGARRSGVEEGRGGIWEGAPRTLEAQVADGAQ